MPLDPAELSTRRREARTRQRRLGALLAVVGLLAVGALAAVLLSGDDEVPMPGTESTATQAQAPPSSPPPPPIATSTPLMPLTPAQLAGQRMIAGFTGTEAPAALKRMIAAGRLSGVILFDDNIGSQAATLRLTSSLQAIERPEGLDQPLAIMVDQEGGAVRRVPGPPIPSAAQMGRRGVEFAAAQGRATGGSLLGRGINVDLAPVLDLARPGSAIAVEGRSFGRDRETVTEVGIDGFAAGLGEAGIAAAAKHFPGLGAATTNTDLEVQRIDASRAELRTADLAPFGAFADAGGELIMLSLASYSAYGDLPAAFDPELATVELRERLGFTGASITDSLDAAAALAFGDRGEVAVAAVAAGTDLLLYGDWRTAASVNRTLSRRLRSGALDRQTFEASVDRILSLRGGLAVPPANSG